MKGHVISTGTVILLLLAVTVRQSRQADSKKSAGRDWKESPFTYVCREETCKKVKTTEVEQGETSLPLDVCKLNCAPDGVLWPKPTDSIVLGSGYHSFYPQNVVFRSIVAPSQPVRDLIDQATSIFNIYLLKNHPNYKDDGVNPFPDNDPADPIAQNVFFIRLETDGLEDRVRIGNNESYSIVQQTLIETAISSTLQAGTYFGLRHALETLSQLVAYDDVNNCLVTLSNAQITDHPVFQHRGVMVDSSRNFISLSMIFKVIEGMSFNKLNVFHWHMLDTHSFPFESHSLPEMTQWGAYSPEQIYTAEEMAQVVEYGRVRGVKILLEFDGPAHVGHGWEWGPSVGKGDLVLCLDEQPYDDYCSEPPCGFLNPVNEEMYNTLDKLFGDMFEIFDHDLFHMGSDEFKFKCWEETPEIIDYFVNQGKNVTHENLMELWGYLQDRSFNLTKPYTSDENMSAVVWSSELASIEYVEQFLPNDKYIIQVWSSGSDPLISFLIRHGYRTIFSNYDAWYLDCGFSAWDGGSGVNWCSPYKSWQVMYENSPLGLLLEHSDMTEDEVDAAYRAGLIMGGETPMWMESGDDDNLETRIWPRASAVAERLWTNPSTSWRDAIVRMLQNRQRFHQRGLKPDRLQPEFCRQNEKLCL